MAPLRHVVRHEVRLLARGRAAPLVMLLLALTAAYGSYAGAQWRQEQLSTITRIQVHDEAVYGYISRQLDDLTRRGNPRPDLQLAGMAWYIAQPDGAAAPAPHIDPRRAEAAASEWLGARHAVLPPAPFSALAIGQSDLQPYYTRVTIRTRPILVHSDEIENPVNLLSGRFDLAFVVTFCFPVLLLPLLYNIVSEEREGGTFALVASQPFSWRGVLMVRVVVRAGVALLLTLVPSLIVLGARGALEGVGVDQIVVWCAAVAAATVFWSGLAMLVNAAAWPSAANAAALLVAWLTFVIVMPALIAEAVNAWAAVPSRVQLVNAVREAGNLSPLEVTALLSTYYEEHPDTRGSNDSADVTAIRGLAQQDEVDRRIGPIFSAYHAAVARQQAMVRRLRPLSPPLLVHDAITELAANTAERFERFAGQVDAYHGAWRRYFYPLVHAKATLTMRDYHAAPRFAFSEEAAATVRVRALSLVAATLALGLAALATGMRRA